MRLYLELDGDELKVFCPFGTDDCGPLPLDAVVELQEHDDRHYQWSTVKEVPVSEIISAGWYPCSSRLDRGRAGGGRLDWDGLRG